MIERIAELIVKHLKGELTPEENQKLHQWIYESRENQLAFEKATDPEILKADLKKQIEQEKKIIDQLKTEITRSGEARVLSIKRKWYTYSVAAAIIILIGTGVFVAFFDKQVEKGGNVQIPEVKDINPPGTNKAMIVLASGKKVFLDGARNGRLATEENVDLVKLADGEIVYDGSATKVLYNTLVNPRGSKVVSVLLSDGTRAWLNCESSLRYPVSFVEDERKVEITGEVYFEVAKDRGRSFKVLRTGSNLEVIVLGTKFNMNTYDLSAITLLEGSVKVTNGKSSAMLNPGQQVLINDTSVTPLKIKNDPKIDYVMAWKDNYFKFSNEDLHSIMKQVSRYYDVEVVFEKMINRKYSFLLPRDLPVSKIFEIFKEGDNIDFKIEGKKIIVSP